MIVLLDHPLIKLVTLRYFTFQKLLLGAKRALGEVLSAFEFMDSHSMDLVSWYLIFCTHLCFITSAICWSISTECIQFLFSIKKILLLGAFSAKDSNLKE